MADRSKLEQMLESLVNGDQAKAEELFHEYVVAQSREIYENLIESELDAEEDEVEEGMEVTFRETDDEVDPTDDLAGEFDAGSEEGGDEFGGDDMGGGDMGGEESEEEIMQDLGAIIDELQAKFDALSGSEEEQGEFDGEDDGADEFGGEDDGEEEEMVDSMDNELETVREYVEKVGTDWDKNGLRKEGEYSGTGTQSDSININSKSIVAGKNDMGGTASNIVSGGTEKSPVEANKGQLKGNGLLKGKPQQMNTGNVNVPGGNAGKTGFKHKEPGHGAEKKGPAEGQFSGKGGSAGTVDKASLFRGRR